MRLVWILLAIGCGSAPPQPPPVAPVAPPPKLAVVEHSEPTEMPEGYVAMHADRVVPLPGGDVALVLADQAMERVLLIFIGGTEGQSIVFRLAAQQPIRPLTHDLLDHLLEQVHGTLVKVQVDELRDEIYFGSVFIHANGRVFKLDARPSDAIALAIGDHAPIYVAKAVLDVAGKSYLELQQELAASGAAPTM